jgi:hypothetical protein
MASTKTRAGASLKPSAASRVAPKADRVGRIFFEGNPWPEGHAIDVFEWTATAVNGRVRFAFHLKSVDYYAERIVENDESGDWLAPSVWGNYHRCTLSSTEWHEGSFDVCALENYTADKLDGSKVLVDTVRGDVDEDRDDYAFHIYLLGHDAVANHQIKFSRVAGGDKFDIDWRGNIALAYAGRFTPGYSFRAQLWGAAMPKVA